MITQVSCKHRPDCLLSKLTSSNGFEFETVNIIKVAKAQAQQQSPRLNIYCICSTTASVPLTPQLLFLGLCRFRLQMLLAGTLDLVM